MKKYLLYSVVMLGLISCLLSPAYARTAENIVGSVTVGEAGYEVPIEVVNNNEEPISGVSARIQSTPRGLKNFKVTPQTVPSIPPGESFVFIVSFDVAIDAEPSDSAEIVLSVTATDAEFDDPSPQVAVKIVKREEKAEEDATPVLKLVRITGPPPVDPVTKRGYKYDYKENQSGYTARLESAGKTVSIIGVAVTHAPMEIIPGQPFHIEVEARQKIFPETPPDCDRERNRPEKPMPYWIARGYAGAGEFAPGVSIKASPFRGWARSKDPLGCGDGTVRLTLKLIPEKHEYNDVFQRWISTYTWRVESDDRDAHGTNGMGRGETGKKAREYFRYPARNAKIKRDIEVKPHKRSTFLFPLTLQYRMLKQGQTAMESLPPYQFPPELSQPPAGATGDTETAGGGDDGRTPSPGTGPGTGGPVNPDRLNPKEENVSANIREWISVAEPPENATEGAKFRYDQWGRKIGSTADGATIRATAKPDYALSTPEETVWSMRTKLDSVNHCTLEEYVVAKLENRTLENCRGRYRASPAVTVTRLTGLPLAEAKKRLQNAGLKPELVAGKPAPTKRDEGTIASQDPGPNAKLKEGDSVRLEIYGPYVSKKLILPKIAGLSAKEAKARLKAMGLDTLLVSAGPAPSKDQSFMVKETQPAAGTKVRPGTKITLRVYSNYSIPLVTVPKVEGMAYPQAKDILARTNLKASPKSAGPAPSQGKSSRIKSQEPGAGAKVKPGSEVKLYVFSKYAPRSQPSQESQRAGSPQIRSVFVAKAYGTKLSGSRARRGSEYDAKSVRVYIDPKNTEWIAWNNTPALSLRRNSRPGRNFLGPGGFGTDDYIALTVAAPDGQSSSVELDHNDAYGRWKGIQNVIFENRQKAPDVFRQYPSFASPPNREFFIDETGSHNRIFKLAGEYTFLFSFRNSFGTDAGHPDVYLLISEYATPVQGRPTGGTEETAPGPITVERADTVDFVGSFRLADPTRTNAKYRGTVNFNAGGTFVSVEYNDGRRVNGKGAWSFDRTRRIFAIDWRPGGRFEGTVSGNTHDFVISGRWSNGKQGRLRIYK